MPSFEQRGLALLASAAGFVTILFGLLAIASRSDQTIVTVTHSARVLVIVALPFLFTTMVAGIVAGFPLRYLVPELAPLDRLLADDVWRGRGATTARRLAEAKLAMLETSRRGNGFKGAALIVGFATELVAVALVAVAVAVVLV